MNATFTEFTDGLKKPFQSAAEQQANKSSAVASYALVLAIIALVR